MLVCSHNMPLLYLKTERPRERERESSLNSSINIFSFNDRFIENEINEKKNKKIEDNTQDDYIKIHLKSMAMVNRFRKVWTQQPTHNKQ